MAALSTEARRLLNLHTAHIWRATDQLFGYLLAVEWFALIGIAVFISPRTWVGLDSYIHPHVWIAIVLGGVAVVPPLVLIHLRPGSAWTRHAVAISQSLMSALLIHLTGGRIESHFHVFGSLACLSFYRDWRVLVTATVITAVDHAARGIFWPTSVFGIAAANSWRWVEHLCWMLYEDFFLIYACRRSLNEMTDIARREAGAGLAAIRMEQVIDDRTSALRLSEQQLRDSRDRAEAANVAKSEFLANMSHEIRTPMTAILGYADLLFELGDLERAPPARVDAIQTIRRNGHHLLDLINDILDLSRIESRKMRLEMAALSPLNVLAEVESLMRIRADSKAISLTLECETAMPATITSDPTRIRQILVNLVGNAIKFTERGGVRIIARYMAKSESYFEIDVVDTGIGIDMEAKDSLFQPFVQADSSTTRRFGGTGLGLTISRRLAEMLGGELLIAYSELGTGTCFRCRIPAYEVQGVTMIDFAPSTKHDIMRTDMPCLTPNSLSNVRVLLAEDGPDNQRLILHYLKRAGAEADVAESGQIAVAMAQRASEAGRSYDAILMDMQMPVMDGYLATKALRDLHYNGVIIAVTAHAMMGDREKCIDAGCDYYISKPADRVALIKVIRDAVDQSSEKDNAGTTAAIHDDQMYANA